VVLILDSRVVKRGYGRTFLASLPDVPVATLPTAELLAVMRNFFNHADTSKLASDSPLPDVLR
jgi:ATP-dependent DNA helicase DinG